MTRTEVQVLDTSHVTSTYVKDNGLRQARRGLGASIEEPLLEGGRDASRVTPSPAPTSPVTPSPAPTSTHSPGSKNCISATPARGKRCFGRRKRPKHRFFVQCRV